MIFNMKIKKNYKLKKASKDQTSTRVSFKIQMKQNFKQEEGEDAKGKKENKVQSKPDSN